MSLIVAIMGATCAGKSTFIRHCVDHGRGSISAVEVGKILRAKYPPEHFAGQNNPKHTAQEAWDLCESMVQDRINEGSRVILVDGQPRDIEQVDLFLSCWQDTPRDFLLFNASIGERERRARETRTGDDLEKLALPRLKNDMIAYFGVLVRLAQYGVSPLVVNTENHRPQDALMMHLLNQSRKGTPYVRPESLRRSWPDLAG